MAFNEHELRAFLIVAAAGSLGRASKLANVTQPSLSKLMQRMESSVGQALFERTSRGMVLTQAGELMQQYAFALTGEMDCARRELDALRGLKRGVLRLGAVMSVLRTFVAHSVGTLVTENPKLTVEFQESIESELRDALVRRELDLIITSSRSDDPEIKTLGVCDHSDFFSVYASTSHPLTAKADLDQVLNEGWVLPPNVATRGQVFNDLVTRLHRQRRVVVESRSVEAIIAVACSSHLLCWMPDSVMAPHVQSGFMRRLIVPEFEIRPEYFVHRRSSGILPDAAREFLKHLPLSKSA